MGHCTASKTPFSHMKTKTKKSVKKRIRITKNGKIVRRAMGIDHFRTRKPRRLLRKKSKTLSLNLQNKTITDY